MAATTGDAPGHLYELHRLVSQFAGRLPDPLVARIRDWLGREDAVGIAEVLVSAAVELNLSVTPQQAELLAALPAAPGRRPGLPPELRVSPEAAPMGWSFGPGGAAEPLDRATVEAVFRDPRVVAVSRSVRSKTGGTGDVAGVGTKVYLVEAKPGARPWQLAAEAQRALSARGVEAPQVEVYGTGEAPTAYQQAALASSTRLWARPERPARGPSVFGTAVDRGRAARVTEWFLWTGEVWGTMTRLHRMLLRLAADLSAEPLSGLRRTLAEGELGAFAIDLGSKLAASGVALTSEEIALLRDLPRRIEEPELDLSSLDGVPVADAPGPAPEFSLGPAPTQAADAAPLLVLLMAGQPGVTQVWQVWRDFGGAAAVPVFLIEVEPGLAAWSVAFDAHLALAPAGEAFVEVFWTGEPLPPFQRAALETAEPLWIATLEASPHNGGIRAAGVYDFADEDGVPRFSADHQRLTDAAECDRLAARMIAGEAVVENRRLTEDVVDPRRGRIVPQGYHTDGEWIWRASAAYYLAEYQLAPDPELLKHLRLMERGAVGRDE